MRVTNETVCIQVPASPEYVVIVRLAVSGLASRLNFSYDDIEDLKLAVSEACGYLISNSPSGSQVLTECKINSHVLDISVKGLIADKKKAPVQQIINNDIGLLLIKSLMDSFEYSFKEDIGAVIHMTKKMAVNEVIS